MKFWDRHSSWEEAEKAWDVGAEKAAQERSLKKLKVLPQMPGIAEESAQNLKWKSFKYMTSHDRGGKIRRHFLKHPLRYGFNYIRSLFKKKGYRRDGDFFLYGLSSIEAFEQVVARKNTLLVVGFSYCQKPHECPSGRFNDQCLRDPENPVCRQCDIGKVLHMLPERTLPLIIPTVHYIGDQIFKLIHANPHKQIVFLITACELTLEMFGDWGNMAAVQGIGVRLDGRICNTMKAFELSEEGIKPGLTVVTPQTQDRMVDLIRRIRLNASV
jgi:hypothetical protein